MSTPRRQPTVPTLVAAAPAVPVRLAEVDVPAAQRRRLAELGIRAGALVTVLGRTAGGGRLLAIGTSRVALDRDTAACVLVETP